MTQSLIRKIKKSDETLPKANSWLCTKGKECGETAVLGMALIHVLGTGKQEVEGGKSTLPPLLFSLLINHLSRLQPIILNCFSKGFLPCDVQEMKLTLMPINYLKCYILKL